MADPCGVRLAATDRDHRTGPHTADIARVSLGWIYGTAGLVGFLAQIVVGIQGRLLPLHGWYRVLVTEGMKPPGRSAHSLGSHRLARWILLTWTIGVPLLAGGLAFTLLPLVRVGSACLLAGVFLNAAQATVIATAQADSSGEADMKRDPAKITTRC
jgi:hypothetical protein